MAQTAWRCSQCGTVNEPGARACRECGKWPSLFDLQDGKVEDEPAQEARDGQAAFDPIPGFEPDPATFDPAPFDPGDPDPTRADPRGADPRADPRGAAPEAGETEERRSRFPRWAVTAVWVIGVLVWIVVRALGDQG